MERLKLSVIFLVLCVWRCWAMSPNEIEDFKIFLEKTSHLDQILVKKGAIPENDVDDDESISDDAWEQSGKFEGDLILNDRQRRLIVEDVVEGLSRNGLKDITKRWPDNELIYYIQKEHFTEDQVQAIKDGIDDLAQASCIKFRPYRKGDRDAVVIQGSRRGCFSNVGYQGGYQVLNLNGRHPTGRGCFRHGTIVHELLHSLGFYHMQSSPDRDDYINVMWENIHEPAKHNFRKYNTFSVSDFGVGYDYDSVLHYGRRAFSRNGQDTLVPRQSGASIGQRVRLSDKDVQKLNKMYCDSDSNNNDPADKPSRKPNNKKDNPKNKPFQGHGIGYHQGKALIIKLPAAETFKLTNTPQLLVFDHFSKAPEAVSQTFAEGIGIGKEITHKYDPVSYIQEYGVTAEPYRQGKDETHSRNQFDYDVTHSADEYKTTANPVQKKYENPQNTQEYNLDMKSDLDSQKSQIEGNRSNISNAANSVKPKEDERNDSGSKLVEEAFERLGKIIKTHVYPSQIPNLEIYKTKQDYSNYYNPETKFEPEPEIVKVDKSFGLSKIKSAVSEQDNVKPEKKESNKPPVTKKDYDKETNPKDEYDASKYAHIDKYFPKEFDSSYGTVYPLKLMPKVKEEKIISPEYSRYKNLAHKHDYSALYQQPKEIISLRKGKHHLFGFIAPLHDKLVDSDTFKKDNEKYDQDSYTYNSPDHEFERVSLKQIQFDDAPDKGKASIFGRLPNSKSAYSLFGVLVPLTKQWYRVDYDPHRDSYSIEKTESSEDYR